MSERQFKDDQKQFRKLRKLLRQIEHLELVPRALNDEEKQKLSKRSEYRSRLNELNAIYKNGELLVVVDETTTFESEENNSGILNRSEQQHVSSVESEIEELAIRQLDLSENNDNNEEKNVDDLVVENEEEIEIGEKEPTSEKLVLPEKKIATEMLPKKVKPLVKDEVVSQKPIKKVETRKDRKNEKLKISIEALSKTCAHEDLITTIDVCVQSGLIVTGSRDTTLKVWRYFEDHTKTCDLLHNLGGHRSSVTFVKFMSLANFQKSLSNLKSANTNETDDLLIDALSSVVENDEDDTDDDNGPKNAKNQQPLVISSSLDCSFRLWFLGNKTSKCVKEFYLYNPINHFDLKETEIVFALDAGKIEYWNSFKSNFTARVFEDSDRVVCVKFWDTQFYSMSQNGLLKIFDHGDNDKNYKLKQSVDLFAPFTEFRRMKRNFKSFEPLTNEQVVIINDNQPFIILFDISNSTFKLISTNSCNYGFTNCFFKSDSQLFVSAYNIDNGSSSINVFDSRNPSEIVYKYSIDETAEMAESKNSHSISSLAGSGDILASGSARDFTIWFIDDNSSSNIRRIASSNSSFLAKRRQMCQQTSLDQYSDDEDDEQEEEENEEKENEHNDEDISAKKSTKSCILQ